MFINNTMTDMIKESMKNLVMEHLICGRCHQLILPPVIELCPSRHNVCSRCETKVEKCPVCKRRATKKRNIDIENIATTLDLVYPCGNRGLGCPEFSLYQNLPKHLSVCSFFGTKCPLESPNPSKFCSWKGAFDALKYHIMAMHNGYCVVIQDSEDDGFVGTCVDSKVVVFRGDKVFVLVTKVDHINVKHHFCINVTYFGPRYENLQFKYQLEIGVDCQKTKEILIR
ncbi:hypothetical protein C0J52_23594 [Blattella germanica]|nr:hypothetical protein C0J52_23594 [Blattella germanica]